MYPDQKTLLCLLLYVGVGAGCAGQSPRHDGDLAAEAALQFAQLAYFTLDTRRAYDSAHEAFREITSYTQFDKIFRTMAARMPFERIEAKEYEIPEGKEPLVIVYAEGYLPDKTFYLRFFMWGTARDGYRLYRISSAENPFVRQTGNGVSLTRTHLIRNGPRVIES